jgi:hypothetical protein
METIFKKKISKIRKRPLNKEYTIAGGKKKSTGKSSKKFLLIFNRQVQTITAYKLLKKYGPKIAEDANI